MKHKISAALLALFFTIPAIAQHRHHWHHHRWHHNHGWVVPAIIGSAVVIGSGYALTRPQPIVVEQPQPIILQSNQIMIDGIIYTKQTMIINGIQQEILVRQ